MRYSNSPFEDVSYFLREHKTISKLIGLIGLCFVLIICWIWGRNHEKGPEKEMYSILENSEAVLAQFPYLELTNLDQDTEASDAQEIDLSQYDNLLEITEGGKFRLTGELEGTVHIAAKEQNVHLFLDGANIQSKSGAAIYCEEADKLVITLLPDTENSISDSGDYRDNEDMEACIHSKCDLTINGTGTLSVDGYYKDAIQSRDMVKILSGNYKIKCKRTGIHGNDGVVITGGNISISSEKNGLKTTKSGADGRGNMLIIGGELSIIAGRYAFSATKADLYVCNTSIYNKSIVDTYHIGGWRFIQEGCVH